MERKFEKIRKREENWTKLRKEMRNWRKLRKWREYLKIKKMEGKLEKMLKN